MRLLLASLLPAVSGVAGIRKASANDALDPHFTQSHSARMSQIDAIRLTVKYQVCFDKIQYRVD